MTRQKKPKWESKLDLETVDMANPYFNGSHKVSGDNPRKVRVVKNLRESAVETLFARGNLDEAQKLAADRFRRTWEACGGAGTGASDYGREYVDGGGPRDPITQRQVDAGKVLNECRKLLGARNYDLVCQVCGQGYALQDISSDGRARKTAADNLRDSLDDLAAMWGIIRRPATQRVETVR
jgi:hypothetical protein